MQHILDDVNFLTKKYSTNNPFELASHLKINVLFHKIGNLKGYYTYDRRFRYIVINRDLEEKMQQVICAHELGHDRLHQPFAKYTPLQDIMLYDMSTKPEREANLFAAEILIPDTELLPMIKDNLTFNEIAGVLDVPPDLLNFKLQVLVKKGHDLNVSYYAKSNFLAN